MRGGDGKMAAVGGMAVERQMNDGTAAIMPEPTSFSAPAYEKGLAGKLQSSLSMKTSTPVPAKRVEFDDLIEAAAANDVYRCSPDDPVAGMTLVRQIAASVARRLPSHVDRDELVSLGALGWAEARVRFDHSRGVPFAGFAAMRIRGAILDGLRACDTLSRGERKRAKADITPTAPRIVSDETEVDAAVADEADAAEILQRSELIEELRAALAQLPTRDRYVVSRHFFDDVPMRAIGIELGVTESRISQIVTAAIRKVRHQLGIAVLPRHKRTAPPPATAARTNTSLVAFIAEVAA
jgi:RNA polymerase sigma factor for flagellar operon FliA